MSRHLITRSLTQLNIMPFYVNEALLLESTYKDDLNTDVDPGTPVTVDVWQPDGTQHVTAQAASAVVTGQFQYAYTPIVPGIHTYRFVTNDNAIEVDNFVVRNNP